MSYRIAERISFESSEKASESVDLIEYKKGVIELLEVEVLAPQLINIRMTVQGEDEVTVKEITYSGNFNILWETKGGIQ